MNHQDRMYMESQAVYTAIVNGEYQNTGQVEAALLDANFNASTPDDDDK
jgi:hypothetical protein